MVDKVIQWRAFVISGLSLVNFAEQNLSIPELATMVDAWMHWARANWTDDSDPSAAIAKVINDYTKNCIKQGGIRLQAQERIIEAFRSL